MMLQGPAPCLQSLRNLFNSEFCSHLCAQLSDVSVTACRNMDSRNRCSLDYTLIFLGVNLKRSGSHITISLIFIGWFQVARLELEGVRVGDQYHTPHFVGDVALLASRYVRHLDMHDLQCKLGGLGIRSNLAILADGVPVGLILRALPNGSYASPRHRVNLIIAAPLP